MRRDSGIRSRLIAWLRVALPLAALALLSMLFLLAREPEGPVDFRMVEDAGDPPLREGARAPAFAGMTPDGALVSLSAERAGPADTGGMQAKALSASITLADGDRIELTAPFALLRNETSEAILRGGVIVDGTHGYRIETEAIRLALDRVLVETLGPVVGESPAGRLEAGRLTVAPVRDDGGPVRLLFTGGVKLLYDPKEATP